MPFKIDYCPAIDIDVYHWGFFCKRIEDARRRLLFSKTRR